MKIVIATGGTAGHIFPAREVYKKLKSRGDEVYLYCFSSNNSIKVGEDQDFFKRIRPCGLDFKTWKGICCSIPQNIRAVFQARSVLKDLNPDVVAGFGGYASFPLVLGAYFLGIPTMIHEQNVVPGKANRFLAPFVKKIAVSFQDTFVFFSQKKTVLTGYPCRESDCTADRHSLLQELGLNADKPTILVFGGSQGSRKINDIFLKTLDVLKHNLEFQVIHLVGRDDSQPVRGIYEQKEINAYVFRFFEDMEKLYSISDLVISRAGAGTIAELAKFQIPAILIPYPHAGKHQRKNAEILSKIGLAVIIEQKDLSVVKLKDSIVSSISGPANQQINLSFHEKYCIPDSAERIVNVLLKLTYD